MNFNINNYVRFQLTDLGVEAHRKYWSRVPCRCPQLNIDSEGYVGMQLWEVMSVFGDLLYVGSPNIFVNNNIVIEENEG